jgi:rubrerythrin
MSGKGSRPRPFSVSQKEFDNRWDTIFGKKKKTDAEQFDEAIMKDEYYDLEEKPLVIECGVCGWRGKLDESLFNEDYVTRTCPSCGEEL